MYMYSIILLIIFYYNYKKIEDEKLFVIIFSLNNMAYNKV